MISKFFSKAGAATAAVVAITALSVSSAFAQDGGPFQDSRTATLEYAYERLQVAAENQANRFDSTPALLDLANTWITDLSEAGIDTAELQAAVNTYEASIAEAETKFNEGVAVLDAGAGFNADGTVSDAALARQTIRDTRTAFRDARIIMAEANNDLRDVVLDYREQVRAELESRQGEFAAQ